MYTEGGEERFSESVLHHHVMQQEEHFEFLSFVTHSHCLCLFFSIQSASMKRPVIPAEFGAKVPTNIRQRYLTVFIDECLKFCLSEEEAYQMVSVVLLIA